MNNEPTVLIALRIPVDLRDHLRTLAKQNRRTLTGEIVHLLDVALAMPIPTELRLPDSVSTAEPPQSR
jgi:hypothetical protein